MSDEERTTLDNPITRQRLAELEERLKPRRELAIPTPAEARHEELLWSPIPPDR